MINLLDLTYAELSQFVAELGENAYRTNQIWQWLWRKRARSIEEMTNISKTTRTRLAEAAHIVWPEVVERQKSKDGTRKLLLQLHDGALVETVLIPSHSREGRLRLTQCLSCQVGCAMGCTFCSTGALGFQRNMTMSEILGQVLIAREEVKDDLHDPLLRNLVFMGMGEPLLNLKHMLRSLETLNNDQGLGFSPRRISVSTCGIAEGLQTLGDSGLAFLAVSLHAPNQELRARIMPKAARWPLEDMMRVLKAYPLKTRERVTFEYLLLGGVNDSLQHAKELARLLSNVKSKLNIIVYNPADGAEYQAPAAHTVQAFVDFLVERHITVIIRKSKGQDIDAACGQLAAKKNAASALD